MRRIKINMTQYLNADGDRTLHLEAEKAVHPLPSPSDPSTQSAYPMIARMRQRRLLRRMLMEELR